MERTVAYECVQLCVADATAHERVDVAEGDRRKGDRRVAQLQTELLSPKCSEKSLAIRLRVLFCVRKEQFAFSNKSLQV